MLMISQRVRIMIRLSNIIAPSFYELHRQISDDRYTHYWLKGGRGSTKSSFVAIQIILGIMKHPGTHAVAIRKVGLYLRDSVYEQLMWAIDKLGVSDLWEPKVSPLELIYMPTGQRVIFRGADKPKKLKSTKVKSGYIRYLWYEECDEFNGMEEIRTINQSLMRGGAKFDVFYTYNPPKSQRNWVNNEASEAHPDRVIHHSTYLTVPREWLGEPFIVEAEHLKKVKSEQYAHEYMGEVTGTGGEVFANVTIRNITDDEITAFDAIRRGIDWGYGADPFAYNALHYDRKRKRIYVYYEYYKVGAKFDAIERAIRKENRENGNITAESAEPRSNDELKDRGLRISKAKKGPGSVEHGISWLQNLEEIIIDKERCPNTAREFLEYELEKDNNGNWRDGFPDKNNHSIDCIRYALENDMKKSGISVLK